jgi:outer membrane autotransporter protein
LLDAGIVLTPNQAAVAQAINDELGLGSDGGSKPYNESTGPALDAHPGLAAAINFLNNESLKNLPGDYDLIAPEELTSIFSAGNALADTQTGNIENRLWEVRNGGGTGFSATGFNLQNDHGSVSIATLAFASPMGTGDDLPPVAAREGDAKASLRYKTELRPESGHDPRWGVFITGGGEFAHVSGDFNANGYNFTTGGMTIGADYRMNEHFTVGIMGGYANTTTKLVNAGSIDINSGKLGIYSTLYGHGFHLDTLFAGGYNNYDTQRMALLGVARGSTHGGEFDGMVNGGYDAHFGKLTVGPVASMQYTYVDINKFDETGSLLPLSVPHQSQESLRSRIGIKGSYDWKTTSGIVITPVVGAAWQHEYLNSAFALDASFAQGAGNLFSVQGPEIGRDSAIISVGVNVQWTSRFGTYLNYDGEFGRKNYQINSVSGGARLNF